MVVTLLLLCPQGSPAGFPLQNLSPKLFLKENEGLQPLVLPSPPQPLPPALSSVFTSVGHAAF